MAGRGEGAAGARWGAHRGQKRELYRGRCELRARASAGGWRRAIHHGHAHPTGRPRRAPPAGQCSGGGGCQCRLGLLGRRPAPRRFQAGQTHAPALAASPVVTSGGAMSAWPRGGRLAARTALERRTCHPAPHWRSTRALRSGRVARAHGSVRAWECDSDRGPWAALTRSTGRSSIVAWSSTHAAGRCRARFARSLGNDPETATINGCRAGLEH